MASAIAQEHAVHQGPVTTFGEHQIEIVVSIHIADAHVGRGLGSRLQQEHAIESWEAPGARVGLRRGAWSG